MDDFRIKSPILNALSLLRLDDTLRAGISTNPSLVNAIFELPVNFINWSPRVKHVFENRKIIRIRDLVNNLEELRSFRNFGAKCYKEVIVNLSKHFNKYTDSVSCYTQRREQMEARREQELVNKIRSLPPEKIAVVDEFIEFLRHRDDDTLLSAAAAKLSEKSFQKQRTQKQKRYRKDNLRYNRYHRVF